MMMVMMGCFILHKTWNTSTLFILCACWEEYFCTVVAGHCFQFYYQKEKVMLGLLVEEQHCNVHRVLQGATKVLSYSPGLVE